MFLLEAFWEVSSDRQVGFGIGPVPFTALVAYAECYGIDSAHRFEEFRRAMRALDAVFLARQAEKSKGKG